MVSRDLGHPATGAKRPTCPTHHTALDGGPVLYWCPSGHGVAAADLDNEFHPAVTR